jgi:hypothetical protein
MQRGSRSEVGASLAAAFIAGQAAALLEQGCSLEAIPALLHGQILSYLRRLIAATQPVNPVEFIRQHLLFTIVGAVVTEQGGVTFSAGDGLICIDEALICIDQSNKPAYIAYHLLQGGLEENFVLPDSFEVYPVRDDWQRLAIASDGFTADLLPQVWGLTHPRGLQRKLNVWGNQERRFDDDATIIVIERGDNHAAGDD